MGASLFVRDVSSSRGGLPCSCLPAIVDNGRNRSRGRTADDNMR